MWVHLQRREGSSTPALRLILHGTGSAEDARGEREQPLQSIPAWKASFLCHPPPQEDAAAQYAGSSAQRVRDLFL